MLWMCVKTKSRYQREDEKSESLYAPYAHYAGRCKGTQGWRGVGQAARGGLPHPEEYQQLL